MCARKTAGGSVIPSQDKGVSPSQDQVAWKNQDGTKRATLNLIPDAGHLSLSNGTDSVQHVLIMTMAKPWIYTAKSRSKLAS